MLYIVNVCFLRGQRFCFRLIQLLWSHTLSSVCFLFLYVHLQELGSCHHSQRKIPTGGTRTWCKERLLLLLLGLTECYWDRLRLMSARGNCTFPHLFQFTSLTKLCWQGLEKPKFSLLGVVGWSNEEKLGIAQRAFSNKWSGKYCCEQGLIVYCTFASLRGTWSNSFSSKRRNEKDICLCMYPYVRKKQKRGDVHEAHSFPVTGHPPYQWDSWEQNCGPLFCPPNLVLQLDWENRNYLLI